ncbi:MAG: DUF1036 domain-containing protein [Hyphomicrobiaceae bacterium]
MGNKLIGKAAGGALAAFGLLVLMALPAAADLKLCNSTAGRIGVVIGYQEGSSWTTEGWWTIAGQTCETLLKGKLPSRVFYVHAIDYDRGGEWAGDTKLCLSDKPFTIRKNGDCEKRGFKQAGFMEVDTQGQSSWTIRLADPVEPDKPN